MAKCFDASKKIQSWNLKGNLDLVYQIPCMKIDSAVIDLNKAEFEELIQPILQKLGKNSHLKSLKILTDGIEPDSLEKILSYFDGHPNLELISVIDFSFFSPINEDFKERVKMAINTNLFDVKIEYHDDDECVMQPSSPEKEYLKQLLFDIQKLHYETADEKQAFLSKVEAALKESGILPLNKPLQIKFIQVLMNQIKKNPDVQNQILHLTDSLASLCYEKHQHFAAIRTYIEMSFKLALPVIRPLQLLETLPAEMLQTFDPCLSEQIMNAYFSLCPPANSALSSIYPLQAQRDYCLEKSLYYAKLTNDPANLQLILRAYAIDKMPKDAVKQAEFIQGNQSIVDFAMIAPQKTVIQAFKAHRHRADEQLEKSCTNKYQGSLMRKNIG